jgi:putative transcriptional regulator
MSAATMTHYHPDQFLLNDYVAGSLPGAVALPIAVHLEYCAQCREEVAQLSRLGAELFSELDPVPVGDDAFARLLERLDGKGAVPMTPLSASAPGARRAMACRVRCAAWRPRAWRSSTGSASAPRCAPRAWASATRSARSRCTTSAPAARCWHTGTPAARSRWCCRGVSRTRTAVMRRGISWCAGRATSTVPVAAADSDCLCLAVLDAPIRLGGLLGRLANPFLRIHPR